jgi:hypothetical protein
MLQGSQKYVQNVNSRKKGKLKKQMAAAATEHPESVLEIGKQGMSETPKLNQLASELFAKHAKERKPPAKTETETKDEVKESVPEPMEVDVDVPEKLDSEEIKPPPTAPVKSNRRKPLPRRHRGAVGAIRLNQSHRTSVYRKGPLFRLVKQVVREEMGRQGIKFSKDSVAMIATAMENIMYRKVAPGQLLSLSGGKSSLMLRHAMLGLKLNGKPDMRQWNSADFRECDQWLERSQFRGSELDVDQE